MIPAGWFVKGKGREMPSTAGSVWRAQRSHCFPQPLELDATAGLAGKVCLWTAAPGERWRNKKIRTGGIWRGEGTHGCFSLQGYGDEGPRSQ